MKYDECPAYLRVYKELVPPWGPSDTIEGEALRGAAYMAHRWFNDGDLPNQEVVSIPLAFLRQIANRSIDSKFSQRFRDLVSDIDEGISEEKYEQSLDFLIGFIVAEIERIGVDNLTNNRRDSISG